MLDLLVWCGTLGPGIGSLRSVVGPVRLESAPVEGGALKPVMLPPKPEKDPTVPDLDPVRPRVGSFRAKQNLLLTQIADEWSQLMVDQMVYRLKDK